MWTIARRTGLSNVNARRSSGAETVLSAAPIQLPSQSPASNNPMLNTADALNLLAAPSPSHTRTAHQQRSLLTSAAPSYSTCAISDEATRPLSHLSPVPASSIASLLATSIR